MKNILRKLYEQPKIEVHDLSPMLSVLTHLSTRGDASGWELEDDFNITED